MKKFLLFVVVVCATIVSLFAQPIYNEADIRLYHTPSQEEIEWAQTNNIRAVTVPTPPPIGELRPIAEYEPAEAVLIRYPFGIPMTLIKEMAKDTKIITIVSSSSQQTTVFNQYNSYGVNTDNCEFLIAQTDTYWTRDYGPWFMAIDNIGIGIFDFYYNRPTRPDDNNVNTHLADYLSLNRYASPLWLTGGNYMNDGTSQAASTKLPLEENPGWTEQAIREHFQEYLGIEDYHFIDDALGAYISHIDCWGKYLAPNKVIVGQVPTSSSMYQFYEAAANYFASLTSPWGTPMQVYRVYSPGATGYYGPATPYTNSIILNKKVFVPQTGNSNDAAAIQAYQNAMPGYEVFGIMYDEWEDTDALHCRTHEIADRCMLYIKHQPYFAEIENTGSLTFSTELYSYCNNDMITDSVLVYLRLEGGEEYTPYHMTYSEDNTWEVTITGLPSDIPIEYYVFAKDESGRRECHPYIGAPDPHKFILTGEAPVFLPVLNFDKTASVVTSEGFGMINDSIIISNSGNANLTFEITDIIFDDFLTIFPLSGTVEPCESQIIRLSYNFGDVPPKIYSGSFIIVSNDPNNLQTDISLQATQDVPVWYIPMISLDKTTSSVTANDFEVIEDFITIANLGNANLEFEIADIDFSAAKFTVSPEEGTVEPDGSQILTLTYDFNAAKNEVFTGSFKITSNDPNNPEIEISLSATIIVGINEIKQSIIYIYPNPANKILNISYNDEHPVKADIYNLLGSQIKETTLTKGINTIDIQDMPAGIYFIRVGAEVFKVVKY